MSNIGIIFNYSWPDELKIFKVFANHKGYVVSCNSCWQSLRFRCAPEIHRKFLKLYEEMNMLRSHL